MQDVSLTVQPPASVQAVGSWADGSAADLPGSSVDVAVQIPSSCLHHKDILNYRWERFCRAAQQNPAACVVGFGGS